MYSGFMLIDDEFIGHFAETEQNEIMNIIYSYYLRCGKNGKIGKKLGMEDYFKSKHIRYKFVYFYCPKCKNTCAYLLHFPKSSLHKLKYCGFCGESNIAYRYSTGYSKLLTMISSSEIIQKLGKDDAARDIRQQIIALAVSVFEVYLRDCYAGILNASYIRSTYSLFDKFIKDCKNDFLNPGKANERYKKELGIDIKLLVGKDTFGKLVELAEYRNVIVHNNGICDKRFANGGVSAYRVGETINPEISLIQEYIIAMNTAVNVLDKEYCRIVNSSAVAEIKVRLATKDASVLRLALMPGQARSKK